MTFLNDLKASFREQVYSTRVGQENVSSHIFAKLYSIFLDNAKYQKELKYFFFFFWVDRRDRPPF